MAEYVALWGRDIETDSSPDPTNGSASNGRHDPITEPIPVISGEYDNGYTHPDGYTEPTGYVESNGYADTDTFEVADAPVDEPAGHLGQDSAYVEPENGYIEDDNVDAPSGYVGAETEFVGAEYEYDEQDPGYVEAEPEPQETRETVGAFSYAEPFIDRRPGSPGDSLTFKPYVTTPWYRTKRGLIVLIALVVVAVVLALMPLLLRGPSDEPTNVTPSTEPAPSSVQPSATSVAPSLTSPPAPPPPPAPSPPPAQETPVYRPQYPSSGGGYGSQAPKPEIGVTRAPISVAPKPVTPPTSAEVGKHGSTSRW